MRSHRKRERVENCPEQCDITAGTSKGPLGLRAGRASDGHMVRRVHAHRQGQIDDHMSCMPRDVQFHRGHDRRDCWRIVLQSLEVYADRTE
jgi:hypothetical protein